jgi:hypothetical protein
VVLQEMPPMMKDIIIDDNIPAFINNIGKTNVLEPTIEMAMFRTVLNELFFGCSAIDALFMS